MDHAKSQQTYGKPVILEEFGVTSNQPAVYTQWLNNVVSSGLAGDLIWYAPFEIWSARALLMFIKASWVAAFCGRHPQ